MVSNFMANETRLKSLKQGDFIYEVELTDPEGGAYFKHEVVLVDLDEMCVNTLDHSQNKKPSRLYGYLTAEETGIK